MADKPAAELTTEERALLEEYQHRLETEQLAARCRASLYTFVKEAWHVLEPGTLMVDNWHIEVICLAVQAVLEGWLDRREGKQILAELIMQNLAINVPPGSAKSRVTCVMAPAWMWLRCPEWRAIFFSGNPRVTVRDSMYRRDLIESEWYQKTFKPDWKLKEDQNAKLQFNNDRGGFLSALTAGQRIIGDRGDALFVDDPQDAVEVLSEDVRTALNEVWWDQGAFNRVNDPQVSTRIGIMQRLHEDDWSGHVLVAKVDGHSVWHHLNLPQEYEALSRCTCGREVCALPGLGKLDPRTEPGELLFPARFPRAVLEQEKIRLKENGYAGQHQQRPFAKGGGLIKRTWFRFYLDDPTSEHTKLIFDEVFQSWDLSFKKTKTSDYVCGQVWGIRGPRRYLLDQVHARMDFKDTVSAVRKLTARWPKAVAKYVEDKANGPAVISALQAEIEGIVPVTPQGGKEARAAAVGPLIEAGNVYLPAIALAPWVEGLLTECEAFPNGLHDDRVDAMTQALIKTINRRYEEHVDNRSADDRLWDAVEEEEREKRAAKRMEDEGLGWAEW